ncbi:SMI1/KNR4 family protein [Celerinatantimonas sp. MCCC 1A17872]|uniref:SMI1/KNR4 family protein n=1 Tax=Celerinatantimonas sp. MCCC 1A17872 TaxID=3177514 RepID=UPI0038CAD9EE
MYFDLEFDSYYGDGDINQINSFENKLGYKFPKEYKEIVSQYNGAFVVNKNIFRYFSNLVLEEVDMGSGMFLPFGAIDGGTETMELKYKFPPEEFTKGLVIFSVLGNGDALCFDYRTKSNIEFPSIVVWHHEGTAGDKNEISEVAANFYEFLSLLYEEDDD